MPTINNEQSDLVVADLFKGDLTLTSPPEIYFKLKKVVEDPNKTIKDAAEIIECDPSLSIRLLKLVNSAFFGFPSQIVTISHAISLIGLKELQNLVLGTLVIERFSSLPGGLVSMQDFWAISLRSALTAKELTTLTELTENTDDLFICGLLHDIGKLVFYRRIPELAREAGLLAETSNIDEIDAQRSLIGFDQYETGAYLSTLWKLPEIIAETIRQHCHTEYRGEYKLAADITRNANLISKMEFSSLLTDFQSIQISEEDLEKIIENVHNKFEAIFSIFYPG